MKKKIEKITRRHGSLVATCETCGLRGGPDKVPWKVQYADVQGSGRSGKVAYRCDEHKKEA